MDARWRLLNRRSIFSTVVMVLGLCFCTTVFANGFLVKAGMHGENVRQVQVLLIDQGYLEGDADGICGNMTVAAIRKFQQACGIMVDGVCGAETYARLSRGEETPSRGGERVLSVSATAYSAQDPGNSNRTANGSLLHRGIIAVDPSFIPLGTRVFIPGYGEAVADDIGWGIHGNTIDVAFDTHKEALQFGRKNLELYILD